MQYAYTFGNTNSFFFSGWNERGRTWWFSFRLLFFCGCFIFTIFQFCWYFAHNISIKSGQRSYLHTHTHFVFILLFHSLFFSCIRFSSSPPAHSLVIRVRKKNPIWNDILKLVMVLTTEEIREWNAANSPDTCIFLLSLRSLCK